MVIDGDDDHDHNHDDEDDDDCDDGDDDDGRDHDHGHDQQHKSKDNVPWHSQQVDQLGSYTEAIQRHMDLKFGDRKEVGPRSPQGG